MRECYYKCLQVTAGAELQAPLLDTLVGHYDAAPRYDQLDVAQAETEDVIKSDREAGREAEPCAALGLRSIGGQKHTQSC